MTLEEKFSSLIKEELPGKVGSELKEVLIKAEKDAKDLKDLQLQYVKLEKKVQDYDRDLSKLQFELKEHDSLDAKLANLEIKEKALEVTILKIQLEEANKRADMVQNFTSGLVRNVEIRKQIYDSNSKQVPITDQYGNIRMEYVNTTKAYGETKKVE
ncbi:MAG: hypothetical protein M0R17_04895 [Candidatus Omnitrophica bacterium]|jgi:hypothetical protein|nr:hypothetical protein [Candidatus Omnitrophota bacterium]